MLSFKLVLLYSDEFLTLTLDLEASFDKTPQKIPFEKIKIA